MVQFAIKYPALKEVCEGRELPAYEAAAEFVSTVSDEMDELMSRLGGKKNALTTLEKLEQAQEAAAQRLLELLKQHDTEAALLFLSVLGEKTEHLLQDLI